MFKLLVCVLVIFSSAVAAEDSNRGRLPDGRAYRTDSQGMELVDHIAELEVTIDELKRSVNGLRFEVDEKDELIAALKAGGKDATEIQEIDLISGKTSKDSGSTLDDKSKVLLNQNEKLQQELINSNKQVASCKKQFANLKKISLSNNKPDTSQQIKLLESKVSESERENSRLESENERLKNKVSSLEVQVTEYKDRESDSNKTIRASMSSAKEGSDTANLGSAKGELVSLYNRTRGVISERDKRFRLYSLSSGGKKSITKHSPRSKRGMHISHVATSMQNLDSMQKINQLRRDLNEISKLMKKDMEILARVSN